MASPFPISSSAPGEGRIVATLLPNGLSGLEVASYQYPLKLISPSPKVGEKSALVFLLSYGGGLVGGDSVNLRITVLPRAKLSVVTQGHTKIFKSPSPDVITRQSIHTHVAEDAGLCLLPDPVQPFEDSAYEQTQIFTVSSQASLCLLDWVTQGRSARGENWSFWNWKGRNEVWLSGSPSVSVSSSSSSSSSSSEAKRLLVRDTVILDEQVKHMTGKELRSSVHAHGLFGTLILRGEQMKTLSDFFLAEFAALPRLGIKDFRSSEAKNREESSLTEEEQWRRRRWAMESAEGVLWSAARVRGCIIVKFGARTVEGGRMWIGEMLQREGSIAEQYGDEALMCVK